MFSRPESSKTVLGSSIIEHVGEKTIDIFKLTMVNASQEPFGIIFSFCSFKTASTASLSDAVKVLLFYELQGYPVLFYISYK